MTGEDSISSVQSGGPASTGQVAVFTQRRDLGGRPLGRLGHGQEPAAGHRDQAVRGDQRVRQAVCPAGQRPGRLGAVFQHHPQAKRAVRPGHPLRAQPQSPVQGFPLPGQPSGGLAASAGQVLVLGAARDGELGLGVPAEQLAERGRRLLLALGRLVPRGELSASGLQRIDLPETGRGRAREHRAPPQPEETGQYRDRRAGRALPGRTRSARRTARARRRPGRPPA